MEIALQIWILLKKESTSTQIRTLFIILRTALY